MRMYQVALVQIFVNLCQNRMAELFIGIRLHNLYITSDSDCQLPVELPALDGPGPMFPSKHAVLQVAYRAICLSHRSCSSNHQGALVNHRKCHFSRQSRLRNGAHAGDYLGSEMPGLKV